jgi:SAM-dependent methyltransferase
MMRKIFGLHGFAAALSGVRQGYSGQRPDVLKMFRERPRNVLDVGCGAGGLAHGVKLAWEGVRVTGIEADHELAQLARAQIDHVVVGRCDMDSVLAEAAKYGPFDYVVCADLLEHLVDPWSFLCRIRSLLAGQGVLITSIPNVRHISTFTSLGLFGRWPRRNRGIHDAGHLRFFARNDILELLKTSGFEPLVERRNLRLIESKAWTLVPAKLLDFWPFRSFFTFQYLHCSRLAVAESSSAMKDSPE